MDHPAINSGRVRKAPENFLSQDGIKTVFSEAKRGRRDFIRNAFAAAAAGAPAHPLRVDRPPARASRRSRVRP